MRKHGYGDRINCGLRLESVTPMALTRSFHNTIDVNTHMNKWWIAPKRYNTYSVVPHATYTTPG